MRIKSPFSPALLGWIFSHLLRALNRTLRWQKSGLVIDGRHWSTGKPMILVFWHSDQLLMPWVYLDRKADQKPLPLSALVSLHGDGRMAAATLRNLDFNIIDGSSTRGGTKALYMLKRALDSGSHVGITPDGPKGPARVAKVGAVKLSSMTGAALLPIAVSAKKKWTFGSWDSMFLPWPGSRVSMLVGDPIFVTPDISREDLLLETHKLTELLNHLKLRCEASVYSASDRGLESTQA